MRHAKSFAVAFTLAFAAAFGIEGLQAAPAVDANTSAIVYDDGTVVVVSREGYKDVV